MTGEAHTERRAETLNALCVEVGKHEERLDNLQAWQHTQNGTLKEILKEITELKKLVLARPAWYYWIVVVGLAVACTYLFTRAFP